MDINIKTTFNIGDKVYIPMLYGDWYADRMPYKITKINIEISKDNDIKTRYIIMDEYGYTFTYTERLCFSNYEDCLQWCKTQNNK